MTTTGRPRLAPCRSATALVLPWSTAWRSSAAGSRIVSMTASRNGCSGAAEFVMDVRWACTMPSNATWSRSSRTMMWFPWVRAVDISAGANGCRFEHAPRRSRILVSELAALSQVIACRSERSSCSTALHAAVSAARRRRVLLSALVGWRMILPPRFCNQRCSVRLKAFLCRRRSRSRLTTPSRSSSPNMCSPALRHAVTVPGRS